MARPIPYETNVTGWVCAGTARQMLRGLIAGLIIAVFLSAGVWALSKGVDSKMFTDETAPARFARYLYESKIGTGIRESVWVFPIVEGTHLLAIALSVGMLCWFDLRLLGLVLPDVPVSKVWQKVMPVAFVGFALMFVTGVPRADISCQLV